MRIALFTPTGRSAMRAPAVGLFYANRNDELVEATRVSATITHAHPLGIEGAVLVASAVAFALCQHDPLAILQRAALNCSLDPFISKLDIATDWLKAGAAPSAMGVAQKLGNGVAASESCVTAVYLALRFLVRPFQEMLDFIAAGRGDVDTIGAMAGAVWGAANGAVRLPSDRLAKLEQRERIATLAAALYSSAFSA